MVGTSLDGLECDRSSFALRFVESPGEEMGRRRSRHSGRPLRSRGLRRSEVSTCSIARSGCPANSLRKPLIHQPRAKLGLSASARSTNSIMAPMSSPKVAEHIGSVGEDARVVAGDFEAPAERDRCPCAGCRPVLRPSRHDEAMVAMRRPGKRGPVMRIALDRLLEQIECLEQIRSLVTGRRHAQARADRDRRRSGRSSAARPSGGSRRPAMPAR